MADEIGVEHEELLALAMRQKETADAIAIATERTYGMLSEAVGIGLGEGWGVITKPITSLYGALGDDGPGFWLDHGPACWRSILAIADALTARRAAGEKMVQVSLGLAEKLENAAKAYQNTDEQTSDNLDKQMITP